MADLEGRLSPSCIEDIEDETLDPRIQVICILCQVCHSDGIGLIHGASVVSIEKERKHSTHHL